MGAASAKLFSNLLINLNACTFYIKASGSFYSLSKRISGINYLNLDSDSASMGHKLRRTFDIIGVIYGIKVCIQLYRDIQNVSTVLKSDPASSDTLRIITPTSGLGRKKCPLCLDFRTNSSCTPCGHIFCWDCIMDSVLVRPECPICREEITDPSLIVYIQNYE